MSIIIHGANMPKNYGMGVGVYPNGVCIVFTEKDIKMYEHIWAEQLPPHGRLIDADALMDELQKLFDKRKNEYARFIGNRGIAIGWNDAIFKIRTAPTIIEAEGVKE